MYVLLTINLTHWKLEYETLKISIRQIVLFSAFLTRVGLSKISMMMEKSEEIKLAITVILMTLILLDVTKTNSNPSMTEKATL